MDENKKQNLDTLPRFNEYQEVVFYMKTINHLIYIFFYNI